MEAEFLSSAEKFPLVKTGGPGRVPNFGNSNWKFTPFGWLAVEFPRPLPAKYGGKAPFRVALRPAENESLFLYSRNSTDSLSIWARRILFSWFADSDAFSRSCTLTSKSFKCFSLRSRKALCAALFCALRFCEAVSWPLLIRGGKQNSLKLARM